MSYAFSFGQEKSAYSVGIRTSMGQAIGHTDDLRKNFARTYSLVLKKPLSSKGADWIEKLNAKNLALEIQYAEMKHIVWNVSFGQSFSAITKVDFLLWEKDRVKLIFAPGIGLGYVTKTAYSHPESFIFSSHLNAVLRAGLEAEIAVAEKTNLAISTDFSHISNGAIRLPNAGVNLINIGLGISKEFGDRKSDEIVSRSTQELNQRNFLEIAADVGQRGNYKEKKGILRTGFFAGYGYQLNEVFAFKAGSDLTYIAQVADPNVKDRFKFWGRSYDHWKVGIALGTEIKMNKVAADGRFGYYLHLNGPYNQKTYWNLGLKYYVTKNMGVQARLHSHKFQADYTGIGFFVKL